MKRTTRIAALLLVILALSALLIGCAANNTPAATIGDREITVSELASIYANNYAQAAAQYGLTLESDEDIATYRDSMLDSLIEREMLIYQAHQKGLTLTNDELKAAKESAAASYQSLIDYFVEQASNAGSTDPKVYANTLLTDWLLQNDMTVGKYKKQLQEDAESETLINKFTEDLLADVAYTEDELKAKYDEELASQKELFTTDPSQYFTYESGMTYGANAQPLYIPEGLIRVRHILVKDAAAATLAKKRIDAGEDFETVLTEVNTDTAMESESNAEGYLIGTGSPRSAALVEAALALANDGDVSDVVKVSDTSFYIIKRMRAEESRELPYEEVKDNFDAYMQYVCKNDFYTETLDKWTNDESLVTRYPDNYADVGKN